MKTTAGAARRRILPLIFFLAFLALTALASAVAAAGEAPPIDSGDTAWVLTASAMVLLMTPGLAFFYGGLVRRKNILSVLMQCFVIICRMKFSAFCLFALLWATFVYAPVTHWVWGDGGFMRSGGTLDAFGVHGVGGIWGVLATGLFATKAANPAGADGLFYGGSALLGAQAKGTLVTVAWSLLGTYLILKALDLVMSLRVSEHEERIGLDLTGHRESAYTLLD